MPAKKNESKPWNKNIWKVAKATPWKGICCSRCYTAKSEKKRCKCRCHGEHHGVGRDSSGKKPDQKHQSIDDGSLSLDGGKTTSNRADGKAPWEPYPY